MGKDHGDKDVRLAIAWILGPLFAACSHQPFPTQPSGTAAQTVASVALEGEAGIGDGQVKQRSRASGGQTVHLGPGERRLWMFAVGTGQVPYDLAITYANGKEGPNEVIHVAVDGRPVSTFENRDSGDSIEGWNTFVTDPAGTAVLGLGSHTLTIEISGGDGCVEIDVVTLKPAGAVALE